MDSERKDNEKLALGFDDYDEMGAPTNRAPVTNGLDAYDEYGALVGGDSAATKERDSAGMRFLTPIGVSGWAIASGYLGLFSFGLVPALGAIVTGFLAIRDIRHNPEKRGLPRALFGIVMGVTVPVIWIYGVLFNNWWPNA